MDVIVNLFLIENHFWETSLALKIFKDKHSEGIVEDVFCYNVILNSWSS